MALFIFLIEVTPRSGSPLDPEEIAGAAVRCYVPAMSFLKAIERLQDSLSEMCLDLVDVEWGVNNDEVEWENSESPDADNHLAAARENDVVVYGEFHVWGHDAPDA